MEQPSAQKGRLPFREQIDYFKQKVRLPTSSWTDLWQGQHARAFVVAGAAKDGLLVDLQQAVQSAIEDGTTLQTFRKAFDQAVATYGWAYNGGRNWRTRVIYDTNLRTSYQAGRFQQLQDAGDAFPNWKYVHVDPSLEQEPRPEHLAWNGLVLSADDPFWKTHYPPNGWGCQCTVDGVSRRELKKMGKSGPDQAPKVEYETVTVGTRGPTPRTVETPKGVDPGWGYNVGEAAWGRGVAQAVLDGQLGGKWVDEGGKTAAELGRPAKVPIDEPRAQLGPEAEGADDLPRLLAAAIGGPQATFTDPAGQVVLINEVVAEHIAGADKRLDGREQYFPLLKETIEDPFEVWVRFARNELTGRYGIRRRYVKAVAGDKDRSLLLVADSVDGVWTGFTWLASRDLAVKNARRGMLVWGREVASDVRSP